MASLPPLAKLSLQWLPLRPWISLTIHGKNTPSISLKIFLEGSFLAVQWLGFRSSKLPNEMPKKKKKKKGSLKCAAPFHEPWLEIFVPWDLILAKNQVSFSWSLNSFIFFSHRQILCCFILSMNLDFKIS